MWWVPFFEAGLAALELLVGLERANKICLFLLSSNALNHFAFLFSENAPPVAPRTGQILGSRVIAGTGFADAAQLSAKNWQNLGKGLYAMQGNRQIYNQAFTNYARKKGHIPQVAAGTPLVVQAGKVRLGPQSIQALLQYNKVSWEIIVENGGWVIRTLKVPSPNNVVAMIADVKMVRTDAALAQRIHQLMQNPRIRNHL